MKLCFSFYFGIIFAVCSCSDEVSNNPAIIEANAEYALAKQKSDLDAMFLSLSKLRAMDALSEEQDSEFDKVSKGLPLIEKIRRAASGHDHETVVVNSADFLQIYPDNAEVRKFLVESSNIFNELELVLKKLQSAFPEGKIRKKVNDEGTEETDLVGMANLIIDANVHALRANELDPNFTKTKEIAEKLKGTRRAISFLLAASIYNNTKQALVMADKMARLVYNAIVEVKNVYPAGFNLQKQWNSYSSNVSEGKKQIEIMLSSSDKTLLILRDISDSDVLYNSIKKLTDDSIDMVDLLLDPTGGNLNDWSKDIDKALIVFKKADKEINSSMPNNERLISDFVDMAILWSEWKLYSNSEVANGIVVSAQ